MRRFVVKSAMMLSIIALVAGTTACGETKKKPKPKAQPTAKVENGTAKASGDGDGQSDTPFVVGCTSLNGHFNPFMSSTGADSQSVDFTQAMLFTKDRSGRIVRKGINGEIHSFHNEDYTYYGIANIKVRNKKEKGYGVYRITIRDDIRFSDGQPMTIDDVIFSIYAFCDESYEGSNELKYSTIRGLLNYQLNSDEASKLTDEQVDKYIAKKPKALKKWMKNHSSSEKNYQNALKLEAKKEIIAKRNEKRKYYKKHQVDNISGIQKINDYEMRVYTEGYDKEFIEKLIIPVCPLHYYGDTTKYAYEQNQFGFVRGDLSHVVANKTSPMGAGPYRFIKYDKGIAYFMANEMYFQGCPKTTYVQLKDMDQIENLQEKGNTQAYIQELTNGSVDLFTSRLSMEDMQSVIEINKTQKRINTKKVIDNLYSFVGMNPHTVKVGKDGFNAESKLLRKAFGVVLYADRGELEAKLGDSYQKISVLGDKNSWFGQLKEAKVDKEFAYDREGEALYKADDKLEKKREKAKKCALKYLEDAGYEVTENKVTSAPEEGTISFELLIPGDEGSKVLAEAFVADMQELGITINVQTMDASKIQEKKSAKSQQLWFETRRILAYGEMEPRFGYLDREEISQCIQNEKELTEVSDIEKNAIQGLEAIKKLAVEVPVCQQNSKILVSSERVDQELFVKNNTKYYNWIHEMDSILTDDSNKE